MTMSKSALVLICLCSPGAAFTGVHTPGPANLKIPSTTTLGYSRVSPTADGPNSIKTALPLSSIAIPPGEEDESLKILSTATLGYPRSSKAVESPNFIKTPLPVEGYDSATLDGADVVVVCDLVGCAVSERSPIVSATTSQDSFVDQFMSTYWGPRVLLAAVACLYGTNFPLGAIMDHALPASAATSARFVLAGLALSPFLFQIHRDLIGIALFAGCFTGMGYVAQSMALVDTSPATVSFLGAAVVIWCPFLEWLVNKKPMGFNERPQTWIAATLCLMGVGVLELFGGDASTVSSIGVGDGLALLQAVGFGTGIFMSEKMMQKHPDQALPITSVLVATTAFISMLWSLSDGWIGTAPGWESMTLPNLLFDPSLQDVAMAVVWTGLLSTSLNFFLENVALGKVPAGEASVILATEPLWAAAFAAVILGESFGWNEYAGGFLIVAACLVNSVQPEDLKRVLWGSEEDGIEAIEATYTSE